MNYRPAIRSSAIFPVQVMVVKHAWVNINCSNPHNFGFYITNQDNGIVGADYLF